MAKPTGRENNGNLIRLSLASAVIFGHSPELIDGSRRHELLARLLGDWASLGVFAVDGFILLSGYLIAQSWERDPRLLAFFRKRAARIYPGFAIACLVSALDLAPMGSNPASWYDFRAWPLIRSIATLDVPAIPVAFIDLPHRVINGPLWTFRYEFAASVALAAAGFSGLLSYRRLVLASACGLTAWAAAQARGLGWAILPYQALGVSGGDIPRLASFFFAGTAFHLYRDVVAFDRRRALLVALLLVPPIRKEWSAAIALPALGGFLRLAVGLVRALPGTGLIRREDLSYGIYLYAWPIQQLILAAWRSIDPWMLSAATLPLAALAGWLSLHSVESRAMRRSHSQRRVGDQLADLGAK